MVKRSGDRGEETEYWLVSKVFLWIHCVLIDADKSSVEDHSLNTHQRSNNVLTSLVSWHVSDAWACWRKSSSSCLLALIVKQPTWQISHILGWFLELVLRIEIANYYIISCTKNWTPHELLEPTFTARKRNLVIGSINCNFYQQGAYKHMSRGGKAVDERGENETQPPAIFHTAAE